MRQIWPVTPVRCFDVQPRLWMIADHARQAEQLERNLEIEVAHILGDRGAFGVLALAQLEIRPEPADLAFDRQPGSGIVAECFGGAVLRPQTAGLRAGAGLFAPRVLRDGADRTIASPAPRPPRPPPTAAK